MPLFVEKVRARYTNCVLCGVYLGRVGGSSGTPKNNENKKERMSDSKEEEEAVDQQQFESINKQTSIHQRIETMFHMLLFQAS